MIEISDDNQFSLMTSEIITETSFLLSYNHSTFPAMVSHNFSLPEESQCTSKFFREHSYHFCLFYNNFFLENYHVLFFSKTRAPLNPCSHGVAFVFKNNLVWLFQIASIDS